MQCSERCCRMSDSTAANKSTKESSAVMAQQSRDTSTPNDSSLNLPDKVPVTQSSKEPGHTTAQKNMEEILNSKEQTHTTTTSDVLITTESSTPQHPPVPEKSSRVRAMTMPVAKTVGCPDAVSNSSLPPVLPPRIKPEESSTRPLPPTPLQPRVHPTPPDASTTPALGQKTSSAPAKKEVVEVTTLEGLAKRPTDLPAEIRFIDGYYGKTSRFSVSSHDCFQVNFLKRSKVLTVHDSLGREYTIPLTSTTKFGLLYDDTETAPDQSPGTVSSILAMKQLPPVICAHKGGEDKKGNVRVREGDVLAVKGKKKKNLLCYNLRTGSDISLQRSFEGEFTLDPKKTRIFPLDIVNHLPDVFPCKAKVYSASNITGDARGRFQEGTTLTLQGCTVDVSLVATGMQSSADKSRDVVYFPLDKNLSKLRIEILASEDAQHLYEDAKELMQNFDHSVGLAFKDVGSDAAFDIQSTLLQELRPDQRNIGVELVTNQNVYAEPEPVAEKEEGKHVDQATAAPTKDNDREYESMDAIATSKGGHQRKPPLPSPRSKIVKSQSPSIAKASDTASTSAAIPSVAILPHSLRPAVPPRTPKPVPPTNLADSDDDAHEYSTISDYLSAVESHPVSQPKVVPRKPRPLSQSPQPAKVVRQKSLPPSSLDRLALTLSDERFLKHIKSTTASPPTQQASSDPSIPTLPSFLPPKKHSSPVPAARTPPIPLKPPKERVDGTLPRSAPARPYLPLPTRPESARDAYTSLHDCSPDDTNSEYSTISDFISPAGQPNPVAAPLKRRPQSEQLQRPYIPLPARPEPATDTYTSLHRCPPDNASCECDSDFTSPSGKPNSAAAAAAPVKPQPQSDQLQIQEENKAFLEKMDVHQVSFHEQCHKVLGISTSTTATKLLKIDYFQVDDILIMAVYYYIGTGHAGCSATQ